MKRKLLITMLCIVGVLGWNRASAQTWTGAEGKVYLQNVGSGKWWGSGNDWGTRASLVVHPEYVTLVSNGDGTYKLESQVSNGGTAYYFNGDFMDNGSPVSLTIEPDGDSWTIANGTTYYGYDGNPINDVTGVVLGKGVDATTDNGKWRIYSEADMMATLDAATLTNGVDATFLIKDHSFGRNYRWRTDAWTMVASNQNLSGGNNVNNCAESYHSNFTLTQTINGVPNGEYELKAQGFYRQDGSDNTHLPVFYINDGTATFPLRTGDEGNMGAASESFSAGNYTIDPIRVTVGDGKITLGAKLEGNTNLWCIFDNFTLTYFGIDLSAYESQITTLRETLTALVEEGKPMNAAVLATANTALTETASVEHTQAAMEAAIAQLNSAIEGVNTSVDNYAAAKVYLDMASTLDEAGQASYSADETVAAVQSAYDAATLEALTDEQKAAMDAAIIAAAKVQTTAGSDWTLALVNPSFENGFTGWTNSGMQTQGNKAFGGVAGNLYCEAWQPSGTKSVKQTVTLPAGVYAISAKTLVRGVTSGKLFANGIDEAIAVSDDVNSSSVQFACEDNTEVEFGFEGTGTGAGNSWLCVDDFHLTLVSAGLPDVTAVTGKMNAAVAAAQADAIAAYNDNKTVANYNAANAAIANAQASIDAYSTVPTAIAKANAQKEAHNFASEAATTTFAEAIAAIQTGYDEGTLTNDEANAAATTLGVAVTGWRANPNGAAVNYLENGFGLNDFGADLYINTWSVEGDNDGTGFSVPFYEYWTGDANSLGEKTWTGELTGLENGLYEVEAWVRVRAKNETAATEATGITMDVNGGTVVDVTGGNQIGEGQFMIGTYTAEGLVKQGKLILNFNIAGDNNISWLSFKNIKYTKVRDLTPDEAFIAATADDYAALNAAIEAHALGFEAGEYAPYNNVEAIAAVAAAQAIDQTAVNAQEDVQAATAAITGANWTENTDEVNAIYDGTFAAAGNDGAPAGWETTHGSGLGGSYHARAFVLTSGMSNYDNLEAFGQGDGTRSAFYIRFDGTNSAQGTWYNYGGTNGYTMPLKANTTYKVTLQAGAWGNYANKNLSVTVKDANGASVLSETITTTKITSSGGGVDDGSFMFTTNDAGNYTFSLWNGNGSNYAAIVSNIILVKATGADLKDALLAEIEKANAVDVNANVGTGVFQIPVDAPATLSMAIDVAEGVYANAEATIEEVRTATTDMATAVEAYKNTELNAPNADQLFNVILTYGGWTYDQKAMTYMAGDRSDMGGYNIKYNAPANQNLAQAFTFTKVDGNNYKMSQIDADGNVRYLSTGAAYSGGNTVQIRTTTDESKALVITVIPTATEGKWNLKNTEANNYIGSQDAGVYTVNSHIDFNIVETSKPSIDINTTAAGWGTVMLPFAAQIPANVKVYSCAAAEGDVLTLTEVSAIIEANKPYIIEGDWKATLTGDAQGTALNYNEGWLTGVYVATPAPVGSYVLQKLNDEVCFYQVANGENMQPTVGANRAYLTDETGTGIKAFFFNADDATGINGVFNALHDGESEVFNAAGVRQNGLQKGLNIIRMKDGSIKKVMVK